MVLPVWGREDLGRKQVGVRGVELDGVVFANVGVGPKLKTGHPPIPAWGNGTTNMTKAKPFLIAESNDEEEAEDDGITYVPCTVCGEEFDEEDAVWIDDAYVGDACESCVTWCDAGEHYVSTDFWYDGHYGACPDCNKTAAPSPTSPLPWCPQWLIDHVSEYGQPQRSCDTQGEAIDKWGVDSSVNPVQLMADFYLAEAIKHQIPNRPAMGEVTSVQVEASMWLDEMAALHAENFARYFLMACGGEFRHEHNAGHWLFTPERYHAWGQFADYCEKFSRVRMLELARSAFYKGNWSSGFGGRAWGDVADVTLRYLRGEISALLFCDRVFTLQHNNGSALNKITWGTTSQWNPPAFNRRGSLGHIRVTNAPLDHIQMVVGPAQADSDPKWNVLLMYASSEIFDMFYRWWRAANRQHIAVGSRPVRPPAPDVTTWHVPLWDIPDYMAWLVEVTALAGTVTDVYWDEKNQVVRCFRLFPGNVIEMIGGSYWRESSSVEAALKALPPDPILYTRVKHGFAATVDDLYMRHHLKEQVTYNTFVWSAWPPNLKRLINAAINQEEETCTT